MASGAPPVPPASGQWLSQLHRSAPRHAPRHQCTRMTERQDPMMADTATDAYSSFTVTDLESIRTFHHDVLGLQVEDRDAMLTIRLPGGASAVAYASRSHQPARFTILNIVVPDLPSAVA